MADPYREFVNHPRYGRQPLVTGLNPDPFDPAVRLYWSAYTIETKRIPNTAIVGERDKQQHLVTPITHYIDLEQCCHGCKRLFIFFAAEQKYWIEVLQFGEESTCLRCIECRKQRQQLGLLQKRYQRLFHLEPKSPEQIVELVTCCVELVEMRAFSRRKLEFARMMLRKLDAANQARLGSAYEDLLRKTRA